MSFSADRFDPFNESIDDTQNLDLEGLDKELEKLLNLQKDIEVQSGAKKAQSMSGEIPRHEYEKWKAGAMRVKKRAVARYRELKELRKHANREEHSKNPGEHTMLLREILDVLLDIRDLIKDEPKAVCENAVVNECGNIVMKDSRS